MRKIGLLAAIAAAVLAGCAPQIVDTTTSTTTTTTVPDDGIPSKLDVNVNFHYGTWTIGAATNAAVVLVPRVDMGNGPTSWNWTEAIYQFSDQLSSTMTFTNISSNTEPSGGGYYTLFVFADANNNDWFDGGGDDPMFSGRDVFIDGKADYSEDFDFTQVTGTVTFPAAAVGTNWYVCISPYANISEQTGYASGVLPAAVTSFDYNIVLSEEGSFYIFGWVDIDGDETPSSGDYAGYFGVTPPAAPSSPNADITFVGTPTAWGTNAFNFATTNI